MSHELKIRCGEIVRKKRCGAIIGTVERGPDGPLRLRFPEDATAIAAQRLSYHRRRIDLWLGEQFIEHDWDRLYSVLAEPLDVETATSKVSLELLAEMKRLVSLGTFCADSIAAGKGGLHPEAVGAAEALFGVPVVLPCSDEPVLIVRHTHDGWHDAEASFAVLDRLKIQQNWATARGGSASTYLAVLLDSSIDAATVLSDILKSAAGSIDAR